MRKRLNNIFFVFGVVVVIVMFLTFDVSFVQLWAYIRKASYWLGAILALWLLLYIMNALAWRIIIKGSGTCDVGFGTLCKLTIAGFALNYVAPMGMIGGDAYRIMELSRYIGVHRATSSVILFNMMHIFSHFWFWITGVAMYLILAGINDLQLNVGIVVVLLFVIAFCYGGIYLFVKGYKNGMLVKLVRIIGNIPGLRAWGKRFADKHKEDLEKIDKQIAELQCQNRKSFMYSLLLEYIGRVFQCIEIFFMLLLFDIDGGGGFWGYMLTFFHSFLILAFTSLFANLLGFLPLQLGGREGGFAMSVTQMGMNDDISMFVSIICRARELFWTSIGILLMKIGLLFPDDKKYE
ncbi:MAG: lysylphosphatidylglycerol synthase transmembrane domain-containing protein [Prevotellaceae bacterium]|nr:lysylphosphatidylglycerol synthase transmembrane domain-containing protein [Prevotellaceae bacterium]